MKRKHIILLWVAIGLAVAAILVSFLNIIPTVTITGETYIGILVTVLGILITFAVGYQIFSTIDLKESTKRMDDLDNKLEMDWIELKNDMYNIETDLCYGRGVDHFGKGNYPEAIRTCTKGLYCSLFCDNADMANAILEGIDTILKKWNINESYDTSKFVYTIRKKKPIDLIIERFDEIINECSDCALYGAYVDRIKDYKTKCEQKIKEHEEWLKNNEEKESNK